MQDAGDGGGGDPLPGVDAAVWGVGRYLVDNWRRYNRLWPLSLKIKLLRIFANLAFIQIVTICCHNLHNLQLGLTYEDGGLVPARGDLERHDVAALQGPARPVAGHQGAGARHAAEEPADGGVGLVAPPVHTRPQAVASAGGLVSVTFGFIIVFPAAPVSIRFFVLSVSRLSF